MLLLVCKLRLEQKKFLIIGCDFVSRGSLCKMDNSTESFSDLDCANGIPSFSRFHDAIDGYKLAILLFPATCCILIWWISLKGLMNLVEIAPKCMKSNCIAMISIYPLVSVCSFTAIIMPRAYFFMDTIGHFCFMVIFYQFYR